MATVGELHQFQSKVIQPWRALGQVNVPSLYFCSLRVHPRQLVDFRPECDRVGYPGSRVAKVLNQRGPRSHVFNDDRLGAVLPRLIEDLLFQLGISKLVAQEINKIVVVAADEPGRSDRIVTELAGLRSNIPTLNNLLRKTGLADALCLLKT